MSELLVAIYHNIAASRLGWGCDLKGVAEERFNEQLVWLCRSYEPVTMDRLADAAEGRAALPGKGFCLTFDDGYRDQFLIAAERLRTMRLTGTFFLNTQRLEQRRLLAVDKQRFLQYGTPDFTAFLRAFCRAVERRFPEVYDAGCVPTPENIAAAAGVYAEFPFYSNEERFYRKIRDQRLTEEQVTAVVEQLFEEFFDNEAEMVRDYFMSWDDARGLRDAGMHLGGHSHAHPLLTRLSASAQRADIRQNVALLSKALGVSVRAFSYPYGACNDDTVQALRAEGIRVGFLEGLGVNTSGLADPHRLWRIGPEKISDLMAAEVAA